MLKQFLNIGTLNFILLLSNYLFVSNLIFNIEENYLIIQEIEVLIEIFDKKVDMLLLTANELFFVTQSLARQIETILNISDFTSSPIFLIFSTVIILGKNICFSAGDLAVFKQQINNAYFADLIFDNIPDAIGLRFTLVFNKLNSELYVKYAGIFSGNSLNSENIIYYSMGHNSQFIARLIKNAYMLSKMNTYHYNFIVQNDIPFTVSEIDWSYKNYIKFIAYLELDWPTDLRFYMNPTKGEYFGKSHMYDIHEYSPENFYRLFTNISFFFDQQS